MEMDFKIYDKVDSSAWDSALIRLNGTIKHSIEWAQYRQKSSGLKPLFFMGNLNPSDNNISKNPFENPNIMALCLIEQSSKLVISTLSRSVLLESFPAIANHDPDKLSKGILWLEDYFKYKKYRHLRIESSQSSLSFRHVQSEGYQLDNRFEFILDLTLPLEELWKNLKDSHKRKIRSIEKLNSSTDSLSNVQIVESYEKNDILNLRDLQENSSLNAEEHGHGFSLADENQYSLMKECLIDKKLAKLFLTKIDRDILSGVFITTFHKKCYYMYGGSSKRGFELSSSYFQFWEILKQLKMQGFTEFNFGGVPASAENENSPSHGLYRFKRGFGTRIESCIGGSKILNPVKDRLYKLIKS